jgi:hypothetical protein
VRLRTEWTRLFGGWVSRTSSGCQITHLSIDRQTKSIKLALMQDATFGFRSLLPLFALLSLGLAGGVKGQAPDLTKNMTPVDCAFDFTYSYNLGPTGLRGWIYVSPDNSTGAKELMTEAGVWRAGCAMGRPGDPPWQASFWAEKRR